MGPARHAGVCNTGVRNYQARNFMRHMKVGDQVLFYYSSVKRGRPGIAGVCKVGG